MVRSEARPSSGLEETDLVWPSSEDPTKVHFILLDSQECQLWDILGRKGLTMESDLAKLSVKLEEAQERVESVQRLVKVDLRRAATVSFLRFSLTPWSFVGCLSMLASRFCRVWRRCHAASPVSSRWSMLGWLSLIAS